MKSCEATERIKQRQSESSKFSRHWVYDMNRGRMWTATTEVINLATRQFKIFQEDKQLSYADIIELWKNNFAFREFYISLLTTSSFQAFFWELPPLTLTSLRQSYKFVLVDSPQLVSVKPNSAPFAKQLESAQADRNVTVFENLGKDATLVVPRQVGNQNAYIHLAAFIRNAPESQVQELFKTLGETLEQHLNEQPVWVSTSGLGVFWLHVRLDSRPKYYSFQPYRNSSI